MSTKRIKEILSDKTDTKLEKVVTEIFNLLDSDKNEKFEKEEFVKFLDILCDDMGIDNLTLEEHGLLFDKLDKDKSGTLEKNEVLEFIREFLEKIISQD
jgi:Ca2+-binding EF-hand superfamily protein